MNGNYINIHCTTLNCGGQEPDSWEELLPIFEIKNMQNIHGSFHNQIVSYVPDMYIIALQEMVSLNAKNIMITNKKKLEEWRARLIKVMETINERNHLGRANIEEEFYDHELQYTDKQMVGCYLAIFHKKRLAKKIPPKSFQACRIKAGAAGVGGNKGAVCIRFEISGQGFMVINCHLASGGSKDNQRTEQLMKIFDTAFEKNLR